MCQLLLIEPGGAATGNNVQASGEIACQLLLIEPGGAAVA